MATGKKRKPADAVVGNVKRLRAEVKALERLVKRLEREQRGFISCQCR